MTRAEILDCLTDRPCDYCKFHESGRCERWDCVFEEKPDDAEADAISRQAARKIILDEFEGWPTDEEVAQLKRLTKQIDELPSVNLQEPCEDADDYENEIADLQNRLDIAEYDKERWKEKVTVLDEKLKALSAEPDKDAISRQAAIDVVHEYFEKYLNLNDDICLDGIRSLPSVTPKVAECEDVISRQAVKDKYRENFVSQLKDDDRGVDLSKYMEEPYKRFCKFMDSIPPVTPKQKMGYWILDHVVCDVIYEYHCSACGHHLELGGRTIKQDQAEGYSLFCNGCGAKMRESEG